MQWAPRMRDELDFREYSVARFVGQKNLKKAMMRNSKMLEQFPQNICSILIGTHVKAAETKGRTI